MKIVKPDNMAVVHRTLRWHAQDRLAVGLVALFPLASGRLDALRPETELWQQLAQAPGAPAVLDEGYPKPKGEFLLYGEACAPGAQAVTELVVRARVGAVAKSLIVHGDRQWSALGTISAPAPFTRMPLVPANAFGGAGDEANLLGKAAPALPNVEDPSQPIVFKGDRPAPAGYWGADSGMPQRQRHLGAVDKAWLQETWPHLPQDTREAYFQSAPADQRLAGFFAGDEDIELIHMHPAHPRIAGTLPGLRGRCFAALRGQGAQAEFREIATRAETLWLLPGQGVGAVLYRGTLAVEDEEAQDVACLVMGWERLHDAPLPESHYRDQLPPAAPATDVSFEAPSAGGAAAAPRAAAPASLAAASDAATGTAEVVLPIPAAVADPALEEIERLTAEMDARTDRLLAEHGIPRSQIHAMMPPPPPRREVSLAEIDEMTQALQAQHAALLAQHGVSQADVDGFVRARQGGLPPANASLADIDARARQMQQETAQLMRDNGIDHDDVAEFLRSRGADREAVSLMRQFPALTAVDVAPSAALERDAPSAASASPTPSPAAAAAAASTPAAPRAEPKPAPEPAPAPVLAPPTTREEVIAWHAQARSFAGLTLDGLDLRNLDLADADFSAATLEQTRFDRSRLAGARFDHAILQGASFEGADATGASFHSVRAAGSRLAGAALGGATLTAADFSGSDFTDASLQEARCTRADFRGSRMPGLRGARLQAERADFSDCALQAADLAGATLTAARFDAARMEAAVLAAAMAERSQWYATQAPQADFGAAMLRGARAGTGSVFAGANLRGANLDGAAWSDGVDLQGAALQSASLVGADLGSARANGVQLARADAKGANLSRAVLDGADASGANLMGASLRHARLERAALDGANLHASDVYGAELGQARMTGALTTGTLLRIPGRPEARGRA